MAIDILQIALSVVGIVLSVVVIVKISKELRL